MKHFVHIDDLIINMDLSIFDSSSLDLSNIHGALILFICFNCSTSSFPSTRDRQSLELELSSVCQTKTQKASGECHSLQNENLRIWCTESCKHLLMKLLHCQGSIGFSMLKILVTVTLRMLWKVSQYMF